MTTQLEQSMSSRSAISVLLQIDCEIEAHEAGKPLARDVVLGPFGVFDTRISQSNQKRSPLVASDSLDSCGVQSEIFDALTKGTNNEATLEDWSSCPEILDMDMLLYDSVLQLGDDSPKNRNFFDPALMLEPEDPNLLLTPTFFPQQHTSLVQDALESSTIVSENGLAEWIDSTTLSEDQRHAGPDSQPCVVPRMNLVSEPSCISEDAAHLLRYYRERISGVKGRVQALRSSPWQILFLPCALETFAELSLFGKSSHTRSAMLHAILSISALQLRSSGRTNACSTHWRGVGTRHRVRAQCHLREALQTEILGSSQASYKELLMAMLSCAIMSVSIANSS